MSQSGSAGISFNRPTSLALKQNHVLVHSSERPKIIYECAIHNNNDSDSELVERTLVVELQRITTGPFGFIVGVSKTRQSLFLLRDDDYRIEGIPYKLNGESITAISFDSATSLLIVSAAMLDGISAIYELHVSNYGFELITTSYIPSIKITGILKLSSKSWMIADAGLDELSIFTNDGVKERTIASYGRGLGSVRYPDCLIKIPGGYACIVKHNYTIQFYNEKFELLNEVGGKGASGVSFDLASDLICIDGILIVADMNNDRVVGINLTNYSTQILCDRAFCPGILSRPTSFDSINDKIVISDRDNDALQVFDGNLNFLNYFRKDNGFELIRPTSVQALKNELSNCVAVLCRGISNKSSLIVLDVENQKLVHRYDALDLNDPQGMVVTPCGNICIMDTLNRRALLYSISQSDLKLLNEADLASLSGRDRFLCRVPSIIDGNIYFSDYHSDLSIVLDKKLNYLETISVSMSNFGVCHVRKIQRFDNKYFAITRGDRDLAVVNDFSASQNIPLNLDSESVVDILEVKDNFFFLLKEKDQVLMIPKVELNLPLSS